MNNTIKSQLQKREFEKLKDQNRVILKWATGCGKSKMAIDLINYQVNPLVSGKSLSKVLFVVAERAHIKNWEDEFDKWHLNKANIYIDICCYASLKNYKDYSYDTVVLDEAHHVFSEKRMAALEEVRDNLLPNAHIYLLSATLSSAKKDMIKDIFGNFAVSAVTLKDAIESDILPDPKVYVVAMELDNKHSNQTVKIGNDPYAPVVGWAQRAKYVCNKIPCIIHCTEQQKYAYMTSEMEYWKQRYARSNNQFQYNKWVNMGSQRKLFLGNLKTGAVRTLIQTLSDDRRFVCFCASVAQATELNKKNTISSRKPTKYNQGIIDAFNAKTTNQIYAVGMINEGMNLADIQIGIIVQLDRKERLFIQKFGRSMRAENPVSFIFYYKGTQDEKYLKEALENIDAKFVQHININQLNSIKL